MTEITNTINKVETKEVVEEIKETEVKETEVKETEVKETEVKEKKEVVETSQSLPINHQSLSPEKIEQYAQEMYNSLMNEENKKPVSKEDLRKRLREKINNQKVMRKNNSIKEEFLDKKLKESGIEDIEKFKENIKKMDPTKLLQNLKL